MLYDLIEKKRGRETVVMTDNAAKVRGRKRQLSECRRGEKVEFLIRESDTTEKYKKRHKFRSH